MVNKRRPRISASVPVRRLFDYFHKMIKIHCNRCNAILSQQWEFIFINSDVFSWKWVYLNALLFSSLFKMIAFFSSCVRAVNFAGTTSPTPLFLFPVTVAVTKLSTLALWCEPFNKRRPRVNPRRYEKLNKRRGAYSSKYGIWKRNMPSPSPCLFSGNIL